jgi:hypothetical protein
LFGPRLLYLRDQRRRNIVAGTKIAVRHKGPGIRIIHFDRDIAEPVAQAAHHRRQRLIGGIESLHIADLDDTLGLVPRRDDCVGIFDGVT